MNLVTALQLISAKDKDGISVIAEKGANINFNSDSVVRITIKEEYRTAENNETSGKITGISRDGITLNEKNLVPYGKIKEIRITAQNYS